MRRAKVVGVLLVAVGLMIAGWTWARSSTLRVPGSVDVIRSFTEADARGDRMQGGTSQNVWRHYAGPPAEYDTIDVVANWTVVDWSTPKGDKAAVGVIYGRVAENCAYSHFGKASLPYRHEYQLQRIGGKWKITSLLPRPQISIRVASARYAEKALRSSKSSDWKRALQMIYAFNKANRA